MNAMIPGLNEPKMSSSVPDSKIDFLDPREVVEKKISSAICEDRILDGNGLLPILKEILFPFSQLRIEHLSQHPDRIERSHSNDIGSTDRTFCCSGSPAGTLFSIPISSEIDSSTKFYCTYADLEEDFLAGYISSAELRPAVAVALNRMLDPLREAYQENMEWQSVTELAYNKS